MLGKDVGVSHAMFRHAAHYNEVPNDSLIHTAKNKVLQSYKEKRIVTNFLIVINYYEYQTI